MNGDNEHVNEKLREAGELLGIPVIDRVIIGEGGRSWSSGSGSGSIYLKMEPVAKA